jgi:hypothetical protein
MKAKILIAVCLLGFFGWGAHAIQAPKPAAQRDSSVALTYLSAFKGDGDKGDTICTPNENYQGCCSNQGGIADIRGDLITCKSGASSASCSGVDVDLSGCCSKNDGVARVDSKGRILCSNDEESPTCRINACAADAE